MAIKGEDRRGWYRGNAAGADRLATIDDQVVIGRGRSHLVVVRGILLPCGEPP